MTGVSVAIPRRPSQNVHSGERPRYFRATGANDAKTAEVGTQQNQHENHMPGIFHGTSKTEAGE